MKHPVSLRLRLEEQGLQEDDEIEIEIGSVIDGHPTQVTDAVAARGLRLYVRVDAKGNGNYRILKRPLLIDLIAGPANRFEIVAPSLVKEGERFEIVFRAEDVNSNVDFAYRDTVRAWVERADGDQVWRPPAEESLEIPPEVSFEIGGVVRVRGVARSSGVFWIATKDDAKHRGLSNPIRVVKGLADRLWWGDPHAHSSDSDGVGTLEANIRFARDVAAIDFVALTDRLEAGPRGLRLDGHHRGAIEAGIVGSRNIFQWWIERQASADFFNTDGRFVTLHAFEWSGSTSEGGDRNIYFAESSPLPETTRLDDLFRTLADRDHVDNVLVVPHVERSNMNFDYHRPGLESAVQIYSSSGASEWLAQEALARGYYLGFLAGSAGRRGRPGYSIWQRPADRPYEVGLPGGLTAVRAPTLDRRAVVRAIRQRRCYATTGARLLVDFDVDGKPMGEMINTRKPPTIRVEAHGTAPLSRVDLIRDQFRLTTLWPRGRSMNASFQDVSVLPGRHYYYARIRQADGEIAWTSPVWVTVSASQDSAGVVEATARSASLPAWNDEDADRPDEPTSSNGSTFDAKKFTDDAETLRGLLETQDGQRQWTEIVPVASIKNPRGDFLRFHALRDGKPVTLRFWKGFTTPRIHMSAGRAIYGTSRPD
jgi:hypothetical protein